MYFSASYFAIIGLNFLFSSFIGMHTNYDGALLIAFVHPNSVLVVGQAGR